ncbi:MAG: nucleotidyltransferase family protein [Thermoplasmata archaeon]|nr:nucleotidyltransferase family protein [Thermoplasmata archaeon]NIS10425.1 nucleotidyltransferase family protein [Thermoplasmata archaeon]
MTDTHTPSGTESTDTRSSELDRDNIDMIKSVVNPILKEHGVKRAGLFGSFVRDEAGEGSDVDLLVELDDDVSLLDIAHIKGELEEALGLKVDLVEYSAIDPRLRERILAEEVVIL